MAHSQIEPKFNFKETAPCFFAVLVDVLGFGLVYPVLTALFTENNGMCPMGTSDETRYFYLGLAFVLYPLMMFFGSTFLGFLSDRIGRKRALLLCMLGLALSFICIGLGAHFRSLPWLLFGRAFSGLMAASEAIALAAIVDLSVNSNKTLHMSYVALAQSIGFVLGPLIGGIFSDSKLSTHFDFATPFYICAFLGLVVFLWIYYFFQETRNKKEKPRKTLFGFFKAIKSPRVAVLSVVFFFMQVGFGIYLQVMLIDFQKSFGYTGAGMGLFNGFLGLCFILALLFIIPPTVKRFKIEWIIVICMLVAGLSQLFTSSTVIELMRWAFALPLACSIQVAYTGMFASFSNAADKDSQGLILGLSGSIMALSWAVSGFCPNLVPYIRAEGALFIGGVLIIIATSVMAYYCAKMLPKGKLL